MASYSAQDAEAALKLQLDAYCKTLEKMDWDTVATYHHTNDDIVNKGVSATYGQEKESYGRDNVCTNS